MNTNYFLNKFYTFQDKWLFSTNYKDIWIFFFFGVSFSAIGFYLYVVSARTYVALDVASLITFFNFIHDTMLVDKVFKNHNQFFNKVLKMMADYSSYDRSVFPSSDISYFDTRLYNKCLLQKKKFLKKSIKLHCTCSFFFWILFIMFLTLFIFFEGVFNKEAIQKLIVFEDNKKKARSVFLKKFKKMKFFVLWKTINEQEVLHNNTSYSLSKTFALIQNGTEDDDFKVWCENEYFLHSKNMFLWMKYKEILRHSFGRSDFCIEPLIINKTLKASGLAALNLNLEDSNFSSMVTFFNEIENDLEEVAKGNWRIELGVLLKDYLKAILSSLNILGQGDDKGVSLEAWRFVIKRNIEMLDFFFMLDQLNLYSKVKLEKFGVYEGNLKEADLLDSITEDDTIFLLNEIEKDILLILKYEHTY